MTSIIYSNGSQECERIASLLSSLNGNLIEYKLGIDFSDKDFLYEFGPEAQYPQVAIGIKHIGGMKETLQHLKAKGVV